MPVGLDPWSLVGQGVDTSGLTPQQLAQFNWLSQWNGVPPDVARSLATSPSYIEGQGWTGGWPTPYAGQDVERGLMKGPQRDEPLNKQVPPNLQKPRYKQDVSYQPGGNAMPGMPWDDPSVGASIMGGGPTPDMLKRIQLYQAIMGGGRGAGGMQLNPNTQNLVNQLSGQQGGGMQLPPWLLQYLMGMQNQQGGPGNYPQGGGGVTLAQLLGMPQQQGSAVG